MGYLGISVTRNRGRKKKLRQVLVEGHQSRLGRVIFDDVISGNGQGLTLLLQWVFCLGTGYFKGLIFKSSGLPGVGKTLTAEGIADL